MLTRGCLLPQRQAVVLDVIYLDINVTTVASTIPHLRWKMQNALEFTGRLLPSRRINY